MQRDADNLHLGQLIYMAEGVICKEGGDIER